MIENGLFIFRRDLRINDNTSLNLLHSKCKNIYTVFIFRPEQLTDSKNKYKYKDTLMFMIESLQDLSKKIQEKGGNLYSFYGDNTTIIEDLITSLNINIIGFNHDYSRYAIKHDKEIEKLCEKMKIEMVCAHDYYLNPPGTIFNGSGEPYQNFTSYYEHAIKTTFTETSLDKNISFAKNKEIDSYSKRMPFDLALHKFTDNFPYSEVYGGREQALNKLNDDVPIQIQYENTRNNLNKKTSEFIAYIKFGCISIREVYKKFKSNKDFVRQLIWRDYMQI